MKSKITLVLFFISVSLASVGQSLAGTSWDAYVPSVPPINLFTLHFTTDSVEIIAPPNPGFVISSYTQAGNVFTITDKPGVSSCGQTPGQYTFSITNDTLSFVNVTDTCADREATLTQSVFIRSAFNVNELLLAKAVKIYPNPAQDYLMLDFSEDVVGMNYSITNSFGQLVSNKPIENTNQRIELTGFEPGIYFLSIEGYSAAGIKFMKY